MLWVPCDTLWPPCPCDDVSWWAPYAAAAAAAPPASMVPTPCPDETLSHGLIKVFFLNKHASFTIKAA
ncbi:hypothetical protein HanRHA438_Chr01g0027841 [Helianthus annuus]|nr:hypothetical protein HanRHA438_Chr01g0027841 [Helianthus annuus]